MKIYTCDNHRPLDAASIDSMREAAEHFALLKAKKEYGRNARVGAIMQNSVRTDGKMGEYNAFIGKPSIFKHEKGSTVGRSITLCVNIVDLP